MVNERVEMLEKSTTLYFGPWYRKSPYLRGDPQGGMHRRTTSTTTCTCPGYYDDPDVEYWALVNGVTMWDVGVERTVEVSGKDADRLIDYITCRDLTKCAVGQGKYMPVIAPDGGIVNDPVLLHVEREPLVDAAGRLRRRAVCPRAWRAASFRCGGHVARRAPHAGPGPAGRQDLEKLVGPGIYDVKYYWMGEFEIDGIPVVISRTGWTAVPGLRGQSAGGRRRRTPLGRHPGGGRGVRHPARSRRARLAASRPASSTTART